MATDISAACRLCGSRCAGDREPAESSLMAVLALMRAATEGDHCRCPACGQDVSPAQAQEIVSKALAASGPATPFSPAPEAPCPFCGTPVVRSAINVIEGPEAQQEAARGLIASVRKTGCGPCPWCATTLDAEQMLAALRRVAPSGPWDQLEASLHESAADQLAGTMAEGGVECPFCESYAGEVRRIEGEEAQTEAVRALVRQVQAAGYGKCPWCGEVLEASQLIAALRRVAPGGPWDQLEASLYRPEGPQIGGAMSEER